MGNRPSPLERCTCLSMLSKVPPTRPTLSFAQTSFCLRIWSEKRQRKRNTSNHRVNHVEEASDWIRTLLHTTIAAPSLYSTTPCLAVTPSANSRPLLIDVCAAEGAIPKKWGHDAVEIPGSRSILESLEHASAPWAIVTSGTQPLVTGWLEVMGLAHPKHLVSAEQVAKGKPDPACYKLGAERLGVKSNDVLVLEDAPAGVRAGKAAGYKVVALATTHTVQQLQEAGADWIVYDMRSVTMKDFDQKTGKVVISIKDALVQ